METIYKLTSPSGKYYIGRSKEYDVRMKQHGSRSKTSDEIVLYRAIRKYGWENFDKEIIAEVANNEAVELEEFFIKKYNAVKNGYNMTYKGCGGDIWSGRRDTIEYKEYCELQKELQSGENNGFYGKTHNEETIEKLRELSTGYKNGMYGKKHNAETIVELKKKAKGRFSLPWFKDKYGDIEGQVKYDERCAMLRNRNMKKDQYGRFISS